MEAKDIKRYWDKVKKLNNNVLVEKYGEMCCEAEFFQTGDYKAKAAILKEEILVRLTGWIK